MARIAVGGFMHETNTFAPSLADLSAFQAVGSWPPLTVGPAVFEAVAGINLSLAGFVEAAHADGHELIATAWASASPSNVVTEQAFEHIASLIVDGIEGAGRLDAVYLCLHGAMVTAHHQDGEGELLRRVRAVVGADVPVFASLDLHANVTPEMVRYADAMIGYRTYPHVDMAETGGRVANLLGRFLNDRRPLHKGFRQQSFLIPLTWQCTTSAPTQGIMQALDGLALEHDVSLSFSPGFPAADIHHCGPSVIGYGTDPSAVERAVGELARLVEAREADFIGRLYSPEEGVREAMRIARSAARPVVIADTQDNPGAGGDSDTTGMLRALVECRAERAAHGVMVDAEAAKIAHQAGVGSEITIPLGGKSGVPGDAPFDATFRVAALSEGRLVGTGPFYFGARMRLGLSARLEIGGIEVVVASAKVQMADQEIYRFVGIEPTERAILVNKSSVHFRADFEPIAEQVLVCEAPGPMVADPAKLPWTRLRPGMRLNPMGAVWGGSPGGN
jgi:microcystin degradation protein MlrC